MGDLSPLEGLVDAGNETAGSLLVELLLAGDDNERVVIIDEWVNRLRPLVHIAVDLRQSFASSAAAANARANAPTSASPSSSGGGDGAVGETVSAPAGAGGSPTASISVPPIPLLVDGDALVKSAVLFTVSEITSSVARLRNRERRRRWRWW